MVDSWVKETGSVNLIRSSLQATNMGEGKKLKWTFYAYSFNSHTQTKGEVLPFSRAQPGEGFAIFPQSEALVFEMSSSYQ